MKVLFAVGSALTVAGLSAGMALWLEMRNVWPGALVAGGLILMLAGWDSRRSATKETNR